MSRKNVRYKELEIFIRQFKTENRGISPSVREMGAAVGFSSLSEVNYYVNRLELDGRVERCGEKASSRSLQIPNDFYAVSIDAAVAKIAEHYEIDVTLLSSAIEALQVGK